MYSCMRASTSAESFLRTCCYNTTEFVKFDDNQWGFGLVVTCICTYENFISESRIIQKHIQSVLFVVVPHKGFIFS